MRSPFRFAEPQRVFALERGDRLHRVGSEWNSRRLQASAARRSAINPLTAPATSSIGTEASTRC
jgi:hypothetical protein